MSPMMTDSPKRFYLVDGHSQIFRAYYAPFPPLVAPSGEPVKATFIFTQMLLGIIRDHRPDYLAVAMDVEDSSTGRAKIYPEYKKNREETPEDIPPQIDRIVQIIEIMGIPVYRVSGFEADDVIASIAARLEGEDVELRLVSRDKDLYQLLTDRVKLWDPLKDEIVDPASLQRDLGFRPEDAVEIQTLTGDAIDNIPGIPGIGPKTAAELIRKYRTAAGVLENLEEIRPKIRESLVAHRERIPVARRLVTLDRHVPLDFDLESCRVRPLPAARLRPLLEELRLRRLLDQIDAMAASSPESAESMGVGGQGVGAPGDALARERLREAEGGGSDPLEGTQEGTQEGTLERGATETVADPRLGSVARLTVTSSGHYGLVDTPEAFEDFLAQVSAAKILAVDTETTSLRCVDCSLVGLSFSWKAGEGYYLPIRSHLGRSLDRGLLERLRPILEDSSVAKCGQNLKFDVQVLRNEGIELRGIAFDSMVASYLLRPEERGHDIDTLSREFLGHQKIPTRELLGKGANEITMLGVDPRRLADYAGEDADMAFRLRERLSPLIDASPMRALFYEVEMPLLGVLADMEYAGVTIDRERLAVLSVDLRRRVDGLRSEIHRVAGREFLIDSPRQLAEILFDERKLRVVKKTKTSRSTDAEVLETLAFETADPLPRLVLEYRELTKLRGTYVDPLPKLVSPRTGRLHASFHQTVASTGRLSSSDPNIQNIPVRSREGKEIRKAFVPRSADEALVTADYSQIELRILAHLSRDAALVEAFESDRDIHAFVAAQIAAIPVEEVTREQRSRAKAVNFGIIYGQGPFGLARQLGIPQREASDFIHRYKRQYPGIVSFMDQCVSEAESTGKVTTLLGRQRAIPEIQSKNRARRALGERLAINTVIQGTAADMIKVAMVRVRRRLDRDGIPARLLIQVHDELVLEAPRELAPHVASVVREEMVAALPLSVPVRVDTGWGANWLEAGGYAD